MEVERRLSDKIVNAHKLACEEGKLEVAEILLQAFEVDLSAIGGDQMESRDDTEEINAVYQRHDELKDRQ